MRIKDLQIAFTLFLLSWHICAIASSASGKEIIQAVHLEQDGKLTGSLDVLVTKQGLRVNEISRGLVIVSQAPDWTVFEFNPRSKTYISWPRKDFKGGCILQSISMLGGAFNGTVLTNLPVRKIQELQFQKLSAIKYATDHDFEMKQWQIVKSRSSTRSIPKVATCIVAKEELVAPEAANVLALINSAPLLDRLTLLFECVGCDDKLSQMVKTHTWNFANAKLQDFQLPSGYKLVSKEEELSQRNESTDDLMEFLTFPGESKKH